MRLFLAERFNPCPEDLRPRTKRTRPDSLQVQPAQALGSLPADQNVQEVAAAAPAAADVEEQETLDPALLELVRMAKEKGFFSMKASVMEGELARAIASKMINRLGGSVYQAAAFPIPAFPRALAEQLFPADLIISNSTKVITWKATTFTELRRLIGALLPKYDPTVFGVSRALKTPSEKVIRVLATLIPDMEISWVAASNGSEKLFVNLLYVLSDEDGELHPPKDSDRREIPLNQGEVSAARSAILSDLLAMAQADRPLSPAYFRQVGMEDKASEVAEMLRAPPVPPEQRRQSRRLALPHTESRHYEIDCILDERATTGKAKAWALVRWAGYHPSWEAWRIRGEVGTPLETWEPRQKIMRTTAWAAWRLADVPPSS